MRSKLSTFTLVCLPMLACGGDSKTHVDSGIHLADSPGLTDAPAACTGAASYAPTFGSGAQQAKNYPAAGSGSSATPHEETWLGALNADQDTLVIQLYQGFGGFGSGDVRTGTFPLTGADGVYSTCGACVFMATNVGSNSFADYYFATAGSLTLTSVTGTLSGSLSGVTLTHVGSDAQGNPSDTAVGDCTSTIASASFSSPLVAGSAAFTGSNDGLHVILAHRTR